MSPVPSGHDWLARAREVEEAGFSTLLVSDHLERSPFAPMSALGAVAATTTRLRLGTLVLNNDFRPPAVLVKELGTLALLAPGRVEIGLGAGWMLQDYEQSGLHFDSGAVRVARLGETVEVVDQWFSGHAVTYRGSYVRVAEMPPVPAPPPQRPPLLLGGGGRGILTLAGRAADIVSVNWSIRSGRRGTESVSTGTPERTDRKLEWVREAATGRSAFPELHCHCYLLAITHRKRDATAAVGHWQRSIGAQVEIEELLQSPHVLVGSLEEICERILADRARWGFSYRTFYDHALPDARRVLERLGNS